MIRHYKLSNNFNCVEFDILPEDISKAEEEFCETTGLDTASEDALIKFILQNEYDLLASIECLNQAQPVKKEPVDPPSPAQIRWAKNLGMKNPEKASKQEVAKFIEEHAQK